MNTEKEVKTGASYTRDDDGTFTLTLNGDPVFCVRKEQDAKQIVEFVDRCMAERKGQVSEVEVKTAEDVIRQPKYTGLKNLVLICGAMDEYASLRTQQLQEPKWISVKERLPENRQRVLCYGGSYMGEDSWEKYTDQDDKWFVKRYTHWQLLPEPPKI